MKRLIVIVILIFVPFSMCEGQTLEKIKEFRPDLNEERTKELSSEINRLAKKYKIKKDNILSIIEVETEFKNIQSNICFDVVIGKIYHKDVCVKKDNKERFKREVSCGYMQMQPATFRATMGYWPQGETKKEMCDAMIVDWKTTLKAGVKHLADLRNKVGLANAVGAYNAGTQSGDTNWEYIRKVFNVRHKIEVNW